jgi:hypothetical protein
MVKVSKMPDEEVLELYRQGLTNRQIDRKSSEYEGKSLKYERGKSLRT